MRSTRSAVTKTQSAIVLVVIVIAAAAGAYFALLPAPTTVTPTTTSPTTGIQAPVSVTYWQYGGIPSEHVYVQQLVKQWNSQNPNIQVTWVEKDWATKVQTLTTAFTGGVAPDVVSQDSASRFDFVSLNVYLPLSTTFPSDWQAMRAFYVPETLESVNVNGVYYGVPTYFDGAPFFAFNTAMFKKAGIVDTSGNAKPPLTWSELVADAQKIQQAGIAKWGFSFPATKGTNDILLYESLAYQNGGRWLSDDGKNVTVNTAGWVGALQFYSDLVNKFKVSPLPTESDYFRAFQLFFNNQSAMALGFTWVPAIQSAFNVSASFPYRMSRFPLPDSVAGPKASAAMIMDPTTTFYMISSSKHPKETWQFVRFMWQNAVQQGGWGPKNGIFGRAPVSTTIFSQPEFQKVWPDLSNLYSSGALFSGALPLPSFKGLNKMLNEFLPVAVQSVLLGQDTPQSALNKVQAQSQAYLASLT